MQHDPALISIRNVVTGLFIGTWIVLAVVGLYSSVRMKAASQRRWMPRFMILAGILFFLQGFGLGGVIATFGLVLDLIAFVLFLIFVLASSIIFLRRRDTVHTEPLAQVG